MNPKQFEMTTPKNRGLFLVKRVAMNGNDLYLLARQVKDLERFVRLSILLNYTIL